MNRREYLTGGAYATAKRGTDLPQSKLTEQQVREIRQLHAKKTREIKQLNEQYSAEGLARQFGVSKTTIERVLSFQTWAHVRGFA